MNSVSWHALLRGSTKVFFLYSNSTSRIKQWNFVDGRRAGIWRGAGGIDGGGLLDHVHAGAGHLPDPASLSTRHLVPA